MSVAFWAARGQCHRTIQDTHIALQAFLPWRLRNFIMLFYISLRHLCCPLYPISAYKKKKNRKFRFVCKMEHDFWVRSTWKFSGKKEISKGSRVFPLQTFRWKLQVVKSLTSSRLFMVLFWILAVKIAHAGRRMDLRQMQHVFHPMEISRNGTEMENAPIYQALPYT